MRTNIKTPTVHPITHEGARAAKIDAVAQLRRSVMACMLFEDTFYEDGVSIAERIHAEVTDVLKLPNGADIVANIAYEARTKFKLRHAPLWLVVALIRAKTAATRAVVSGAIANVVQRPDEMAELLAMYWKDGRCPVTKQMRVGLAACFNKFAPFSVARYANKPGAVSMRDVMFLVHPKPVDEEHKTLFAQLASKSVPAPDTWEVQLSAGADKRETFTRLINEGSLGALATLRNLRGMQEAGVDLDVLRKAIGTMKTERVLPFRFISAAKHAPRLEPELEAAMFRCLEGQPKLPGTTTLCVDNSGSMYPRHYGRTELVLSPACRNCYAARVASSPKLKGAYGGLTVIQNKRPEWTGQIRVVEQHLHDPIRWKEPRMIFVNSMGDLFHPKMPWDTIDDALYVMQKASRHTFQVLTKYADNMLAFYRSEPHRRELMVRNTHIKWGISAENQEMFDARMFYLSQMAITTYWLSMEPLLGMVNLKRQLSNRRDGVVACDYCREWLNIQTFTPDHVIPKSAPWNGSMGLENLVPACKTCQVRKSRMSGDGFRRLIEFSLTLDPRDAKDMWGRLANGGGYRPLRARFNKLKEKHNALF